MSKKTQGVKRKKVFQIAINPNERISEVKKGELVEWFAKMKALNYQLVGLEQTTNSIQIQDYHFNERKTAIVLGNEREGIPVELIPYFDAVLEIPQRNFLG